MKSFKIQILVASIWTMTACGPKGFQGEKLWDVRVGSEVAARENEQQVSADAMADLVRRDENDRSLANPHTQPRDFVSKGKLTPSVYFQALLVDDEKTCKADARVNLRGEKGSVLMRICRSNFNICAMEGSCRISRHGEERSFNVVGESSGSSTFMELKEDECYFGIGVSNICLDPFFSVAADMRFHRAGQVIFVPALVGVELPNKMKHSGFLVVRDRGAAIRGANRFDFFSGSLTWRNPANPFSHLNLADRATRLDYYEVQGETAQRVLEKRSYPQIPPQY